MKDTMKEDMLKEGFGKREANKVFKGLFFKEKICNTRTQAMEYLKAVPTSYAIKYKIGIAPSPKMVSLEKRLHERKRDLPPTPTRRMRRNLPLPSFPAPTANPG